MKPSRDISRLVEIMAALRTPVTGCPWDVEQSFETIAPYTIEEAYEVADAIERGDRADLEEELGDLLLQVVYHARMAEEEGAFDLGDVIAGITAKMIRRHPHVFGDETARTAGMAKGAWERIKAQEKQERAARREELGIGDAGSTGLLDTVPANLPALTRAYKLQQKAATVGFDWSEARPILAKIREEIGELETALDAGESDHAREEFGDLLFAIVNLGRHLDLEPEPALAATNAKFMRRFAHIETRLAEDGRTPADATLDEMEALWQEAKTPPNKGKAVTTD